MTLLWQRDWRVRIGTLQVDAPLDVSFTIERRIRGTATAEVKIWNLSRAHRQLILDTADQTMTVEAGYLSSGRHTIFTGDVRRTSSQPATAVAVDGPNRIVTVEARDGGRLWRSARINRAFPPGTPVGTVIRACVSALGLGPGNTEQAIPLARFEGGGDAYPEMTVLSGLASRELTGILRSFGMRWSPQGGNVQIVQRGQALPGSSVVLTPATGMVGSPAVGRRGRVDVRMLMIPDVYPGRTLRIDAAEYRGTVRVEKSKFVGDSAAVDWYIDAECIEVTA